MGPALQPGQRSEHHGDLVRGSFQPVEGRDAPGSERITIGLTAKRLDALGMPMFAIADEGVDMNIGDPVVGALLVRRANPSVFTRLGAPRRLFTSLHRRTGAGAGPPPSEAVEARQHAGQSSCERGFSRR